MPKYLLMWWCEIHAQIWKFNHEGPDCVWLNLRVCTYSQGTVTIMDWLFIYAISTTEGITQHHPQPQNPYIQHQLYPKPRHWIQFQSHSKLRYRPKTKNGTNPNPTPSTVLLETNVNRKTSRACELYFQSDKSQPRTEWVGLIEPGYHFMIIISGIHF